MIVRPSNALVALLSLSSMSPWLAAGCGGGGGSTACDDLGSVCHEWGTDNGMGEQCHNTGHAGDTAACEAIYDDCVTYCSAPVPDAGQADAAPTTADAGSADAGPQTLQHQYTVAPGAIIEATADLPVGTTLSMSFTASGPLAWNMHTHFAGMTAYLHMGTGASASESITAATAGEHYLMWTNNGAASVTLDVTVTLDGPGTMTF